MKKIVFFLAALIPLFIQAQHSYIIKGHVDTPLNGKITLNWYNIESGKHLDSADITNGHFTFKGTIDRHQTGQLIYGTIYSQKSIIFYLEPGTILISYPKGAEYPSLSGTPLNRDLQAFNQLLYAFLDSVNKDLPGGKRFTWYSKEIMSGKLQVIRKFVAKHPASFVSLDQLNQYAIGNRAPEALDSLYQKLSPNLQKSPAGLELATRISGMRSADIGDNAPPITLPDTSGHDVSLADFKGKYVLIDFWATWCGPCMAEMPNVKKAYDKYKTNGFEILGVSLDRPDSKELWKKVIARDHLNWTHISDLKWWNSKAAMAYYVNSVPANFLVDPQGKIIGKNLRGEALQTKLAELFHATSFNLDGKILSDTMLKGKVYLQYEDDGGAGRDSCILVNNTYHFSGVIKDGAIKANLFWKKPADGQHFSGFAQFYMAPGNTRVIHQARFNTFDVPGSAVQKENQWLNNLQNRHSEVYADSAKLFIRQHPDSWISYVALETMTRYRMIDQDTAAVLYTQFSSRLKTFDQPAQLAAKITGMTATLAGRPAIDFIESDTSGKPVSLSSFRGKYVLIKFWASWCHPCRAENKVLTPIYHKYKDKGFEVLGVSLDNAVGKRAWIKAINDDGTDWTQICDFKGSLNDAAVKYGVMVVPTSFLVDPKGNIVAKNLMGEALDKKLANLLN